jgi:two-component system response regulator VicR
MHKILYVEDETIIAEVYKRMLEHAGFNVEVASDGYRALELVSVFEPELILLDLMLPGIDGVEILKNIRSNEKTKSLPVFIFSNAMSRELVQQAWDAGATKCFTKADWTPKELISAIKAHFKDIDNSQQLTQ